MDDLKRSVEQLGERGEPRGAARVLAAARRDASASKGAARGRFVVPVAIAASVTLIGGVAAALWAPSGDGPPSDVATRPIGGIPPIIEGATTTTAAPEVTVPTVRLPAQLIAASRLQSFRSCDAYVGYLRTNALERVGPYGLPGSLQGIAVSTPLAARSSAEGQMAAGGTAPAAAPSADASTTNVQEAGIDEPDIVKSDGRHLFALAQGMLWVVALRGDARVVASLQLEWATNLLVADGRLVAIGWAASRATPQPAPQSEDRIGGAAMSRLAVIDISRPAAPAVRSTMEVEGTYLSARTVAGVPRIVFRSGPDIMFAYPTDGSPEQQAAATAENKRRVQVADLAGWAPSYTVFDSEGKARDQGQLVACSAAYHPPAFSGFDTLSVLSLDVDDPAASDSTSVTASGDIVYASPTRMYVATTGWASSSPAGEITQTAESLVHAFDISDPKAARYKVSGKVRGTPLNQFSLSEHGGILRIATTDPNRGSESFVTTLADQGQALVQAGQVGGLGRNERIYAVRFLGTKGYVVTFRQVDPLYVVDLADPTRPRVTGELKITGYSAYLHPVDDDLLIGVGQDATEEGRRLGSQVSLFDVSNPAAPRLLQTHALGEGSSAVEFDHHAFLYWAPTRLAMVPVMDNVGTSAAVGLRVTRSDIGEVRRVSHPSSNDHSRLIERSVVAGDRLFTYSQGGVLASDLGTLADRDWVPFA
jgi:uncharacterized secreted protein with C-terminal beta-propeller domain